MYVYMCEWVFVCVYVYVSECMCVCEYVCMWVCVCVHPPRLMTWCGMMWIPYDWLYKLYDSCIIISSGYGHRIEACHRNYPCKIKPSPCKPLLHIYSCIKPMYKMECFSYRGGYSVRHTRIETFNRRASLGIFATRLSPRAVYFIQRKWQCFKHVKALLQVMYTNTVQ